MRFCPFCAQENPDDVRECNHCGKRLPVARAAPPRPAVPAPPPVERRAVPRPAPRSRPLEPTEIPAETAPRNLPPVTPAPAPVAARPRPATPAPVAPAEHPPAPAAGRPRSPTPAPVGPAPRAPTPAPVAPAPGSGKLGPNAPTLTPPTAPRTRAPSHTILGMPVDPPTVPSNLPPESMRPPARHDDTKDGVGLPNPPPVVPVLGEDNSERRTTKPLSVDTAAKAMRTTAPRGVSAHAPTIAAPLQRPTRGTPVPKPVDEDLVTAPNQRIDDDSMPTFVQPERPTPAELPPAPTPKRPPSQKRMLPPADEADPDTRDDVPFPRIDQSPTPVLPTMAVPPMPPPPRAQGVQGVLGAVKYLPPLARAIWARQKAQKTVRALLHADQRVLDQILHDLGRAAREAQLDAPVVADEMRRVKAEEDRRKRAEEALLDLDVKDDEERTRWDNEEADRKLDLETREKELHAAEEDLRKRGEERRAHEAERNKIDAQIRAAEKHAAQADARAAKADVTPPEKGGGPNTAANARVEADLARREATGLIPARDIARARVESLDAPIAGLTKQVIDGRAELLAKRKELVEAAQVHKRALASLDGERIRARGERAGAEREMSQRFVSAGTLLNLNRVENPRFASLYARIDELKNGVNAREAAILRLETERRSYDRGAVQKGLLTLGIAVGALILLAIILVVVLAR